MLIVVVGLLGGWDNAGLAGEEQRMSEDSELKPFLCANCKYWQKGGDCDYTKLIDSGICKKAVMFWDCTDWRENESTFVTERVLKEEYRNNGVFVQDGSDYRADMITQPDFGCVKFERKDT